MFLSYNKLLILAVGLFCILAAMGNPPSLHAQGMPDISTIKVDDLSDAQLQELVRRASSSGLSEAELLQMAQARGVPSSEIEKLQKRLEEFDMTGAGAGGVRSGEASKREPRRQVDFNEITQGLFTYQPDLELVRRASSSGLSEAELLQMAQARGVPSSEIEKLQKRLEEFDMTGAGAGGVRSGEASKREPRRQVDFNEITQGLFTYQPDFELG